MNADDYQQQAARTLIDRPDAEYTQKELRLVFAAMQLGGTAGSVIDCVKKGVFHRHGIDREALVAGLHLVRRDVASLLSLLSGDPVGAVRLEPNQIMHIWNVLGLMGEAGEMADQISESIIHGQPVGQDAAVKELGDVLWYVAALCSELDVTMSEAMECNIAKLKQRYPEGYTSADSMTRKDIHGTTHNTPVASQEGPGATILQERDR